MGVRGVTRRREPVAGSRASRGLLAEPYFDISKGKWRESGKDTGNSTATPVLCESCPEIYPGPLFFRNMLHGRYELVDGRHSQVLTRLSKRILVQQLGLLQFLDDHLSVLQLGRDDLAVGLAEDASAMEDGLVLRPTAWKAMATRLPPCVVMMGVVLDNRMAI